MAQAPAVAGGGAPGGDGQERPGFGKMALNFLTTFMVINFISTQFFSGGGKEDNNQGGGSSAVTTRGGGGADPRDRWIVDSEGNPTNRKAVLGNQIPGKATPLWGNYNVDTSLTVWFDAYFPNEDHPVLNTTLLAMSDGMLMKKGLQFPSHYDTKPVPVFVNGNPVPKVQLNNLVFNTEDAEAEQGITMDLEECFLRNCTIVSSIEFTNHDLKAEVEKNVPLMRSVLTGWSWKKETKLKNLFDEVPEISDENEDDNNKKNQGRLVHYIRPDLLLNPVVDGSNHTKQTMPDVTRDQYLFLLPLTKAQTNLMLAAETRAEIAKLATNEDDEEPAEVVRRRKKGGAVEQDAEDGEKEMGDASPPVTAGDLKTEVAGVFEPEPMLYDAKYYPLFYINDFWTLNEHLFEMNETTLRELRLNATRNWQEPAEDSQEIVDPTQFASGPAPYNFTVKYYPLSIFKFMMYTQYEQSMQTQEAWGTMAKDEKDNTKRMILETNPILLGTTMVVTILHLVFEYLAFKNDVQFWKGKKNFKGMSVKTVVVNCYFQIVIFLYLLDGDTSWSVVVPSGIGAVIEFWKLRKIIKSTPVAGMTEQERKDRLLEAKNATGPRGVIRRIMVLLPVDLEFVQSYKGKTKKYDQIALRYLAMAGVPCLIAYTIYSALYENHKGWYSFIIRTQVRFIYYSGFAMMCPQIYINYRMKCVSALPWRTFVYKALNTFIDDLFAFIIKMPTMHRLACFRDDIVFFILLYQRWIYPVNKNLREGEEEEDGPEDDAEEEEERKRRLEDGNSDATKAFADAALAGLLAGGGEPMLEGGGPGVSAQEQFSSSSSNGAAHNGGRAPTPKAAARLKKEGRNKSKKEQ